MTRTIQLSTNLYGKFNRFLGRLLISALFLISAYNKIFSIDGTMSWMEGFGVPGFLLYPTIALEIILPLFVIIGYQARISAAFLQFSV